MGGVLLHDGDTGELRRDHERVADHGDPYGRRVRRRDASARAVRTPQRVAILGSGAQARGHVHSMRAVLDDPEIRIWSRNLEKAEELAGEVGATVAPSVDSALFGAEVVCTTTAAKSSRSSRSAGSRAAPT